MTGRVHVYVRPAAARNQIPTAGLEAGLRLDVNRATRVRHEYRKLRATGMSAPDARSTVVSLLALGTCATFEFVPWPRHPKRFPR